MKRQIINVINFIRGTEPREEMDLIQPVLNQIKLLNKNKLKGTFLLQYDALINCEYQNLLKKSGFEIGVWFEMVEPLCHKAGIKWRGRFKWDWHANCGFSVGYTLDEREKLIDVLFNDFKEIFGYYPRVFGSWSFDAHTLNYANEKYGLDASCFCKEQWGTDGYTLWGGYYGQGYYPSKNNSYSPAQTINQQINVPIFKMLGSDPIYQYDFGLNISSGAESAQGVVTLEPVYSGENGGGGSEKWVDWYFGENFSGNCLTFGYAQAGQENSFGWKAMSHGLEYQFPKIAELCSEGKLECETLGETGKWYKETYKMTPASTIVALNDWKNQGHKTVWYCSKNYRINVYSEGKRFWIRDIYLFDEDYMERYRNESCKLSYLQFDNLPIVDGNRFSGNFIRAGLYFYDKSSGLELTFDEMIYKEIGETAIIDFTNTACGDVSLELIEDSIKITARDDFELQFKHNALMNGDSISVQDEKTVEFSHNGYFYFVKLDSGIFKDDSIISENGTMLFTRNPI